MAFAIIVVMVKLVGSMCRDSTDIQYRTYKECSVVSNTEQVYL